MQDFNQQKVLVMKFLTDVVSIYMWFDSPWLVDDLLVVYHVEHMKWFAYIEGRDHYEMSSTERLLRITLQHSLLEKFDIFWYESLKAMKNYIFIMHLLCNIDKNNESDSNFDALDSPNRTNKSIKPFIMLFTNQIQTECTS